MSFLSDIIYATAAIVSSPLWGWRLLRTGKWRTDWRGRFGHVPAGSEMAGDGCKTVMIHAVSVGEVNAIRLLVDELRAAGGDTLRIVVTTTTDTGTARAKALFEPACQVLRYPLDFSWMVRRFLDAVRPDVVVLTELEVWPTFVAACRRRGAPVIVVNGRLSERSYKRYRLIRPLVRGAFASLTAAGVQDAAYAERFVGMGARADRVSVTGTMKWDTAKIADTVDGAEALAATLGIDRDRPLIVCGSSGPGEEAMFVQALGDLGAHLLIAPRKPERFDEAAAAMGQPVRRSACTAEQPGKPDDRGLFLLDTIGELRQAYALADVVVVGRSFCPLYGSDMIEPIALGRATVIGPNTADFRDMMDQLLAGGGIVQVPDAAELRQAVQRLMDRSAATELAERGRAVIRQQQGATQRHVRLVLDALHHPTPDTQPANVSS